MDLDTHLRQTHKDNLQAAWRLFESMYISYLKDVLDGRLHIEDDIQDLLVACRARMTFAFFTILDIVCDTYNEHMAAHDIELLHNHPDGLLTCLETIVDNYQSELT